MGDCLKENVDFKTGYDVGLTTERAHIESRMAPHSGIGEYYCGSSWLLTANVESVESMGVHLQTTGDAVFVVSVVTQKVLVKLQWIQKIPPNRVCTSHLDLA